LRSSNLSCSATTEYLWELDSDDGVLISDLLLEMGAASTQVVIVAKGGIELDDDFDKTGKVQTKSSTVLFSTTTMNDDDDEDSTARRLVQGVSDIMDLDATKAWRSCRKQEVVVETTFDDGDNSQPTTNEVIEIDVGGQKLILSNSIQGADDTVWAFGDGKHPSTRVMLAGLESHVTSNNNNNNTCSSSLLDYGCGSGIIGLCAKTLLGVSKITAVDISKEALELTRHNFERHYPNDDDDNIQIMHGKDYVPSSTTSFDIVAANIPANTLITLLGTLVQSMADDGVLLLSGYPTNEADMVSQAVADQKHTNLEIVNQTYDSGWVLQVFQKRRRK